MSSYAYQPGVEAQLEALFTSLSPHQKEQFVSKVLAIYGGDWGRTAGTPMVDTGLLATVHRAELLFV